LATGPISDIFVAIDHKDFKAWSRSSDARSEHGKKTEDLIYGMVTAHGPVGDPIGFSGLNGGNAGIPGR